MVGTHPQARKCRIMCELVIKEHSAQAIATIREAFSSENQEAPQQVWPKTSPNLTSRSTPHFRRSPSNNQQQGQHMNASSNDPRIAPYFKLPKPSQTATTGTNEWLDRRPDSQSALIAGRPPSRSPLKNLNNYNNTSTTNSSDGEVTHCTPQHTRSLDQQSGPMAAATASPSRSPYQKNGSPNHHISHNSHPNWQTYTFVDVFVHDLPANVSTFDVYKNFIQYGEIAIITIKNSTGGAWKNQADIRFK